VGADLDAESSMRLGELLIGQGLVTPEAVAEALKRQRLEGGRLGNHLVAMGALTVDQLVVALRGQREVGATLDMCGRTLERWERTHGRNHPNTHRARYSYARALLAGGHAGEAAKHAEAALAGFRATVGEQHAWTDEALQLVADARHAISANEPQLEARAPAA
jgi:Tetratricopeptide repeat